MPRSSSVLSHLLKGGPARDRGRQAAGARSRGPADRPAADRRHGAADRGAARDAGGARGPGRVPGEAQARLARLTRMFSCGAGRQSGRDRLSDHPHAAAPRHPRDRRLVGCRPAGAPCRARGPGDPDRPAAGQRKATCASMRSWTRRACAGAEAIHPGYGFLSENAGVRACLRRGRAHLRRAAARGDRGDGRQGSRQGAMAAAQTCRWCRATTAPARTKDALLEAAQRTGLPGAAQGGGRWRRQGHAGGRPSRPTSRPRSKVRSARRQSAFGDDRRASRALSGAATPYRGADVRRPARPDRAPVRARLLGAAAPPEGDRGGAGAGPLARAARRARRGRGPAGAGRRLRQRRHGRVPDGQSGALLLHRDEHAPPGRAPGDRDGDRASTWSSGSCGSRPASRCRFARRRSRCAGHAIEARIYAEDPGEGLSAVYRTLDHLRFPAEGPALRIETGVPKAMR